MSDLITRHLNVIAASMALLNGQLEALRFAVTKPEPKAAPDPIELPARCAERDPLRCAMQDGDWTARANFGDTTLVRCAGCGFERSGGGLGE